MTARGLLQENGSEQKTDEVWTVGQLNRRVGDMLQGQFSRIWVRGEVSNFTAAASGHWYFSIKDERAAVRAVMFRGAPRRSGLCLKQAKNSSSVPR